MNYIGSKLSILDFIDSTIEDFTDIDKTNGIICDIFAGTSTVGKHLKKYGYNVVGNDIQFYSYVMGKHFIENNKNITFEILKKNKIENPFEYLNNLNGEKGFIYKNYCLEGTKGQEHERLYYTCENAQKIDAIRMKINNWKNENLINEEEYYYLLASLIEAADKVANTASVYEAFLKKIKNSANKKLEIKPIDILIGNNKIYKMYNKNANELIREISGDILYMDPPYNTRKYDTNYHMLETIALYDNPKIKGVTGVREDLSKRSDYCNKKKVSVAFEDIVKNAKFRYILLSYNDEGILSFEQIQEIMSKYGDYKVYEKEHRRFKSDSNRNYIKDKTIEYIHCLKKNNI